MCWPFDSAGELVERPDFHRGDPHVEEFLGQLARPPLALPLDQIFVRPLVIAHPPAIGPAPTGVAALVDVVAVPGAGVVDPDPLADRAAEAAVDRQPDALPEQIPEGDIERREAAPLRAHRPLHRPLAEGVVMALDLARVFAEQIRRGDLMDVASGRGGAEERFPEADQPFVGVDLHPEEIRIGRGFDRLDAGDFHAAPPFR